MKISKNNYSPNDRFLIRIFIKIISLDSSQRVPPMSPCPPLIITTVCPWLINHLSDPWDFNNSNGILLRSNWRKPYPKFYGSSFYGSGCVYLGVVKKTSQKVPTYLPGGGGEGLLIRCWHYSTEKVDDTLDIAGHWMFSSVFIQAPKISEIHRNTLGTDLLAVKPHDAEVWRMRTLGRLRLKQLGFRSAGRVPMT